MRKFFGDRLLADIDAKWVTDYRNHRKAQPSRKNPTRKVKGATVNREMAYLRCMFNFAIERKYISENPASRVKPFDERRERPAKRMLSLEDEQRILENAPPYLRVAIILLAQTGGRTYTEGFSLRWDQIDLEHNVIFFGGKTKTEGSSEPVPLTGLAHDVLLSWKKEQGGKSPFLFPSPVKPDQPITTVKTAWKTTLKNAGVAHFPIYHLRHVFCTGLSWVRLTPLCSARCVIRARKPSATINWGWWSRCGKTSKKQMRRSTAGRKYYVFMTVSLLPGTNKK